MHFSPFDLKIILYLVLFISAILISIYAPGRFLLSKFNLNGSLEKFVLANIAGISLWAFQGYVFGYLQLRLLTFAFVVAAAVYVCIHRVSIYSDFKDLFASFNKFKIICILIIIGSFLQILSVVGSGFLFSDGVRFFGNTEADGVMHLAYIQSIAEQFPPVEPGFAGESLRNYHYWSDLILADLHRIWNLPVSLLFFQFIPLYVAVLTGLAAVALVKAMKGGRAMIFWFVFLLYFSSDASYLVILLIHGTLGFNTPAIDNGLMQFLNMPHVFGKLIFLGMLISFIKWVRADNRWGITTVFLAASLIGIKVYFGIYAAIGLGGYIIFQLLKEYMLGENLKMAMRSAALFLVFLLLSMVIYLPHNSGAGGLVYVYLEWPRSLLGSGSIDWRDWWLRRQIYEVYGNYRNLLLLDLLAVIIAFVSIYGTRMLGFVPSKSLFKFLGWPMIVFVFPGLVIFQLLGLFTIQSSGGVNVFNFFAVSSVFLSLFAAFYLSKAGRSKLKLMLVVIFVALTLPRTFYELTNFFSSYYMKASTTINTEQVNALNFVKERIGEGAIIQAHPYNSYNATAPYMAYFTGRQSYLGGENLLKTHNIDTGVRREKLEEIFKSTDIIDFKSKLEQLKIQYVFLRKVPEEELKFEIREDLLKKVFENGGTLVLQVYNK